MGGARWRRRTHRKASLITDHRFFCIWVSASLRARRKKNVSMRIYLLTHISSTSRSIHTTADGRVRVLSECILLYAHPTMEHGGPTANTHDNHTRQSSRSRLDEREQGFSIGMLEKDAAAEGSHSHDTSCVRRISRTDTTSSSMRCAIMPGWSTMAADRDGFGKTGRGKGKAQGRGVTRRGQPGSAGERAGGEGGGREKGCEVPERAVLLRGGGRRRSQREGKEGRKHSGPARAFQSCPHRDSMFGVRCPARATCAAVRAQFHTERAA